MTNEPTLSARDLIGYALRAMLGNLGVLVGLCAPALLIIVASAALGRLFYPDPGAAGLNGALPFLMVGTFVANVALVPAFTGWHRLLIQGDARRPNGRAYGWDRHEWRYFGVLVAIWCLMFAVNIVVNLALTMAQSPVMLVVGVLSLLAAYLTIWANLGLALPAAAMGDRRRIGEILRLAEGNTRKIAMGLGAIWVLLVAVGVIGATLLSLLSAALGGVYLVFVFGMLFYYVGLVASVGVLSRAYVLLAGPKPASGGSPPSV